MLCPVCGSATKVLDSERVQLLHAPLVRRKRECKSKKCGTQYRTNWVGMRFITHEISDRYFERVENQIRNESLNARRNREGFGPGQGLKGDPT